jgi:hypothetical protein
VHPHTHTHKNVTLACQPKIKLGAVPFTTIYIPQRIHGGGARKVELGEYPKRNVMNYVRGHRGAVTKFQRVVLCTRMCGPRFGSVLLSVLNVWM